MDRSLWLLSALKIKSWIRRGWRSLKTVKGFVLALVGSLVFLPMLLSSLLAPPMTGVSEIEGFRRYAPVLLLTYTLLNIVLSTGERVLYFSPAEIDFLFSGPFRRRQLLLYRFFGNLGAAILTSLVLTLVSARHNFLPHAAFTGIVLSIEFLYLTGLAVELLGTTVALMAYNRRRKFTLIVLGIVAAILLVQEGQNLRGLGLTGALEHLEQSPLVQWILAPFRPFVLAGTAERVWPDLAKWASICLAMDLALLTLCLVLDAQYYEKASEASARVYERLQRMKRGVWPTQGKARVSLPMFPWWGGMGPNFWRQTTSATRGYSRIISFLVCLYVPILSLYFTTGRQHDGLEGFGSAAMGIFLGVGLFAPALVGFDFRPDIDRMEELKVLPISTSFLVIGQLLTTVTIIVGCEWAGIGLIACLAPIDSRLVAAVCVLIVPLNFILVEIENLFFLIYPCRVMAGNIVDFQTMGRQMLLGMTKSIVAGLVAGVAAALGAGVYFLSGKSWAATVAVAWLTLAAGAVGLIPLLALAFDKYDVTRETAA